MEDVAVAVAAAAAVAVGEEGLEEEEEEEGEAADRGVESVRNWQKQGPAPVEARAVKGHPAAVAVAAAAAASAGCVSVKGSSEIRTGSSEIGSASGKRTVIGPGITKTGAKAAIGAEIGIAAERAAGIAVRGIGIRPRQAGRPKMSAATTIEVSRGPMTVTVTVGVGWSSMTWIISPGRGSC